MIEITPEGSIVPIFLAEQSSEYLEQLAEDSAKLNIKDEEEKRIKKELMDSALNKLKNLGLTEEEAKAIIGL